MGWQGRDRWSSPSPNIPVHPAPEQLAVLLLRLYEDLELMFLVLPHVQKRPMMLLVESCERVDDLRKRQTWRRWHASQCISVWYNNATNQDCKALQRVVRLAERISGSTLPSLQDIYLKRCKSRTAKIIKDSNHPGNHLFILLPSGRRYRSMLAKTERLRRSFFPQAIRLLNSVS